MIVQMRIRSKIVSATSIRVMRAVAKPATTSTNQVGTTTPRLRSTLLQPTLYHAQQRCCCQKTNYRDQMTAERYDRP